MKSESPEKSVPVPVAVRRRACQSCGSPHVGRKRYCSRECRQRLLGKLAVTTNLLRAINTRWATFWFTEEVIVLNVAVWNDPEAVSFLWERVPGGRPGDDLARLTEHLGCAWWDVQKKRGSRTQSGMSVLAEGKTGYARATLLRPRSLHAPRVSGRHLTVLSLAREDLLGGDPMAAVKNAFRRRAKMLHPDANGNAELFRQLHDSYEALLSWVERPRHLRRVGLPGKWTFTGARWVPPLHGAG
ncbi:MAG: J domain-containing protein [Thermodesulfobacteriota bacterium]